MASVSEANMERERERERERPSGLMTLSKPLDPAMPEAETIPGILVT